MATEISVGIAGAAGDGLDRSGDTLARTAARLGLHVFTYNAYQSLIRGGHTWLRLRLSEEQVFSHGDHLNVLIALNQDSLERHAPELRAALASAGFQEAELSLGLARDEGGRPDGERYLRRQQFRVRLDTGEIATIYVLRDSRVGKKRWFLYSIASE